MEAEARRKGRTPKVQQMVNAVTKAETAKFFQMLLDDETEAMMWRMFFTGMGPKLDEFGHPIIVDNKMVLVPIEPSPIAWRAFQTAVQYKRGMPIVKVEDGEGKAVKMVEVITIGSAPAYDPQAKPKSLVGR